MSLVGTRPILPDELEQYELHHRARHSSLRNDRVKHLCQPTETEGLFIL